MNLTKLTFTKMQFVLSAIALICFAGAIAYFSMPRAENPLYTVRVAKVITSWPGASPERVEQLVTDKLEKKIQEMSQLDYIESESKTGMSTITVNILDRYKDMRPIWDELRRKVTDAEIDLPVSARKPIVNDEYGDIFGIVVAIVWDGFTYAQIKDIADDIKDEILEAKDVAKVDILGIQDERVFIDYNNDKLREIGLSTDQLSKMLEERNIIQSGGIIYTKTDQIAIEPTGNYVNIKDIKETLIPLPRTDKIIKLEDIADVYRGYIDPPVQMMRTRGHPSLGIAVSMREGGNILQLGEEVTALLEKYQENYPIGIEFQTIAYQPERVILKISEFIINLLEAVLIVGAVMLLFLGLRTGLVVGSLIPVVILITFFLMSAMDIGLNQITLAALIIALGMLVDNAIVMSESILTQTQAGKKPFDAGISSAKELKIPLLISSLTTSAAFLPFYLAKSGTGEYVGSLFLVVSVTLLTSFVISLSMIPLFSVKFVAEKLLLKKKNNESKPKKENKAANLIYKGYRKFLTGILKKPKTTLLFVSLLFFGAMAANAWVPKIFYPPADSPMFTAEIEMPVGSSIRRTESVIKEIEQYVLKNLVTNEEREQGITNWGAYIGNGGPRFRLQHSPEAPNTHYAFILFNTTSYDIIAPIIKDLDDYIFANFPDAKAKIRALEEGTPVDNPVEVRITGKDIETLYTLADQMKVKLEGLDGPRAIADDWGLKGKKVVVNVDEARARRAKITNSDIAKSLESVISGVQLTEFREEDELIPMILRSEVAKDIDLIGTEAFNVYVQETGRSVPLLQVADVHIEWEPAIVFRRNRIKTITVFSELNPGYTATEINEQIIPWLEEQSIDWPLGYRWSIGGEKEEAGKAQDSIFAELPLAILAIIFLLMAQFNSFKKSFIILMTIPLSWIGVTIGLLITGSYFGIMTILGMISLAGIVINNGIVLLDRIKLEIDEGRKPQDAIVIASEKRMRPILLTTITTVSSLLPLLLGGGLLWEPMTIALIFGLTVSTLLTLGIVPVLYALFFKIKYPKDYQLSKADNKETEL